jgi:hypothetical protein
LRIKAIEEIIDYYFDDRTEYAQNIFLLIERINSLKNFPSKGRIEPGLLEYNVQALFGENKIHQDQVTRAAQSFTVIKLFWRFMAMHFPGTSVQPIGNSITIRLCDILHARFFGKYCRIKPFPSPFRDNSQVLVQILAFLLVVEKVLISVSWLMLNKLKRLSVLLICSGLVLCIKRNSTKHE